MPSTAGSTVTYHVRLPPPSWAVTRAPSTSPPLAATTSSAMRRAVVLTLERRQVGLSRRAGRRRRARHRVVAISWRGDLRRRVVALVGSRIGCRILLRRRPGLAGSGRAAWSSRRSSSSWARRTRRRPSQRGLPADAVPARGSAPTLGLAELLAALVSGAPVAVSAAVGIAHASGCVAGERPVGAAPDVDVETTFAVTAPSPTTSRPVPPTDVAVEAERVGERADLRLVDLAAQAIGGGLAAEGGEVVAGHVGDPGHASRSRRAASAPSARAAPARSTGQAGGAGCRRRRPR